MGDKDDEAAIREWLLKDSPVRLRRGNNGGDRRAAQRRAEQTRKSRQARDMAEFLLEADEVEHLISEADPYGTPYAWRELAKSWDAIGLPTHIIAKWLRRGADPHKPSLVLKFVSAKVPIEVAFSKVVRDGQDTGETYFDMVNYGCTTPEQVYSHAAKKGVIAAKAS